MIADDVEAVAELHIASWRAAYRGVVPDRVLDGDEFADGRRHRWRHRFDEPHGPGRATLVAVTDRGVVGFADIGPERPQAGGVERGWGEVYAFYLHPAAWGTGAAGPLMAGAVDHLRASGYADAALWVFRDNPRARAFYARAGWAHVPERGEHLIDFGEGDLAPEVLYQRSLAPAPAP